RMIRRDPMPNRDISAPPEECGATSSSRPLQPAEVAPVPEDMGRQAWPGYRAPAWAAWSGAAVAIALYTVLRVLLIPPDAQFRHGLEHDGAYLAIVARNLLAGRGLVNDAHWLVFLNPPTLPMPYHNGKPLYPCLIAAMSLLTGSGVFYSGF